MKLIKGIKLKGDKVIIPDCSRDDLPEFFKEMGYKVGAEIGVYRGGFTESFCKAGLKMYGIDPYVTYPDFNHPEGQKRMDFLYGHAQRTLKSYDCILIRKMSMEAVNDFADESLDFVYIDGCHRFRYIAEDLFEWTKKVRKGGIVSGHDYCDVSNAFWNSCHVSQVLRAYIRCFDIKSWYVLGELESRAGKKRDKYRSWMFIK